MVGGNLESTIVVAGAHERDARHVWLGFKRAARALHPSPKPRWTWAPAPLDVRPAGVRLGHHNRTHVSLYNVLATFHRAFRRLSLIFKDTDPESTRLSLRVFASHEPPLFTFLCPSPVISADSAASTRGKRIVPARAPGSGASIPRPRSPSPCCRRPPPAYPPPWPRTWHRRDEAHSTPHKLQPAQPNKERATVLEYRAAWSA